MDYFAKNQYHLLAKLKLYESKGKGTMFQDFVGKLLQVCYGEEYIRTRPLGSKGDLSADGYLRTENAIFAMYSPLQVKLKNLLDKLRSDFVGATQKWKGMKKWYFVYNGDELGAPIFSEIVKLEKEFGHVKIVIYGFKQILDLLKCFKDRDYLHILGSPCTSEHFELLSIPEIKEILEHIEKSTPKPTKHVKQVPLKKLELNKLSNQIQELIKTSMRSEKLVRNYINLHHDPEYGNKISESLSLEYQTLKEQYSIPDRIYHELIRYVGGLLTPSPARYAAANTVLAYFFNSCDIFEDGEDDTSE